MSSQPWAVRWIPATYRPALSDRRFALLLPAFAISSLGNGMSAVAIAWLGLRIAPPGSRGLVVGLGLAAFELPALAGGLGLTRWLGRWPGRALLTADCAVRGFFLAAVGLLALAGRLAPWAYVVLLGLSSLMHAWGRGGQTKLVAETLEHDAWLPANALLGSLGWLTMIVGPALAGVLAALLGAGLAVLGDGLSFLILGAALVAVRPRAAAPESERNSTAASPLTSFSGLRYLFAAPGVPALLMLTVAVAFLFGPFEVGLPVYVSQWPGGGAAALGALWSLFGVGAVVGALFAGRVRGLPIMRVAIGTAALWGLTLAIVASTRSVPVAAAALLAGGLIYAPYPPLVSTYLQRHVPAAHLAAAGTAWGAAMTLAGPAGYLLGGVATGRFGAHATVFTAGAATVAAAALAALLRVAGARRTATPPETAADVAST